MSANSALIVYSDSSPKDVLRAYPVLDKAATRSLAEKLFPGAQIDEIGDELLADALDPPEHVAYLGCFPGLDLVCAWKIMPDRPSQLDETVLTPSTGGTPSSTRRTQTPTGAHTACGKTASSSAHSASARTRGDRGRR